MTSLARLSFAIAASVLISGCQMMAGYDKPARIVNADAASREALLDTITTIFGARVTLANNALTDSSVLTIERSPRPTLENPNPLGRNMEMPLQLRLYVNGDDCVLVDQRDRSRYILANTRCVPE